MAEIIQQKDTRREFINALIELAREDDKVVFITPDVGFNYIEDFKSEFSDKFFNFGVTEQTTMTIASAMALAGLKPYVYSMINFVLFRPAEMVRNAVVKHNANVKIIGVKGSEKYKFLGFSHNLIHENEDIDFCKNIGLESYIVSDPEEVKSKILETYKENYPCYIRL